MLQKTEAIVLKTIDWKESSKIVVFYTAAYGKVSAVAKGARRQKNSSIESIEPFTLVDLIYYNKEDRDLQIVGKCAISEFFTETRADLVRVAYASYVIQLVDELVSGREKSKALFDLVKETLAAIETDREIELIIRAFEIKFVKILGYFPLLGNCTSCRKQLGELSGKLSISNPSGGIVCASCRRYGEGSMSISRGAVSSLSYIGSESMEKIKRFKPALSVRKELKAALHSYIHHLLGKRLKSQDFLEELV